MRIITKKQQEEIDKMIIKKLRFVAFNACFEAFDNLNKTTKEQFEIIKREQDKAEQVFYADDVI